MPVQQKSLAIAVARAHCEAWSNHDFDAARGALADDVQVSVTTTKPVMPDVNTTGIDAYMEGLVRFGHGVVPGSMREVASLGDERNALLLVTVQAAFGPDMPPVALSAARLYLLDDDHKIAVERVVFLVPD
jgi:hypothetical protein